MNLESRMDVNLNLRHGYGNRREQTMEMEVSLVNHPVIVFVADCNVSSLLIHPDLETKSESPKIEFERLFCNGKLTKGIVCDADTQRCYLKSIRGLLPPT